MRCPIDSVVLTHRRVGADSGLPVQLDLCRQCQGVWLDRGEFNALVTHFSVNEQKTYQQWLANTDTGTTAPKDFWHETSLTCPKDGSHMQKRYLGAVQEVGIDECPICGGIWFEGSELRAVAKASEPNRRLDGAIAGSLRGIRETVDDTYDDTNVVFWDLTSDPKAALPYIKDMLLNFMIAMLMRR